MTNGDVGISRARPRTEASLKKWLKLQFEGKCTSWVVVPVRSEMKIVESEESQRQVAPKSKLKVKDLRDRTSQLTRRASSSRRVRMARGFGC